MNVCSCIYAVPHMYGMYVWYIAVAKAVRNLDKTPSTWKLKDLYTVRHMLLILLLQFKSKLYSEMSHIQNGHQIHVSIIIVNHAGRVFLSSHPKHVAHTMHV